MMDDIGSLPADIKKSCHISLKAFWNWSKIVLILEQNSGLEPKCQSALKCSGLEIWNLFNCWNTPLAAGSPGTLFMALGRRFSVSKGSCSHTMGHRDLFKSNLFVCLICCERCYCIVLTPVWQDHKGRDLIIDDGYVPWASHLDCRLYANEKQTLT